MDDRKTLTREQAARVQEAVEGHQAAAQRVAAAQARAIQPIVERTARAAQPVAERAMADAAAVLDEGRRQAIQDVVAPTVEGMTRNLGAIVDADLATAFGGVDVEVLKGAAATAFDGVDVEALKGAATSLEAVLGMSEASRVRDVEPLVFDVEPPMVAVAERHHDELLAALQESNRASATVARSVQQLYDAVRQDAADRKASERAQRRREWIIIGLTAAAVLVSVLVPLVLSGALG